MSAMLTNENAVGSGELQIATFYIGELLMGVEIGRVQEISRRADVTIVPHSPEAVRGVMNLRGEVVTVIDLRTVLGVEIDPENAAGRNLILSHEGELIGMAVDRIADIMTVPEESIEPTPPNVKNIDGQYIRGVYPSETEIVALLDLDAIVALD